MEQVQDELNFISVISRIQDKTLSGRPLDLVLISEINNIQYLTKYYIYSGSRIHDHC